MSLPALPAQLADAVDGLSAVMRRLIQCHHFDIRWAALDHDLGVCDLDNRVLTVDAESPISDQLAFLTDCWLMVAVGPTATPRLRGISPPAVQLRLVRD